MATAIFGATTGGYSAVVSTLGRRDVRWRKAAKLSAEIREPLGHLRNAVASAQRGSRPLQSLRSADLRARLDEIEENRVRLSDKRMAATLLDVEHCYSAVLALDDESSDHRKGTALSRASEALDAALDRLAYVERKAPP